MNFLKFTLSSALMVALLFLLNTSWKIGDNYAPPLGKFLSPMTGFWQNAEGKIPNLAHTLEYEQLQAAVSVVYDDNLVPHIFAQNTKDAIFAQGYITASLRLWQMEFQTHAAAGRISELFGHINTETVDFDKRKRRLGLPYGAKKNVEEWRKDKVHWELIESYSAGVNAYIHSLSEGDYPVEYKLLNYAPEPWTPYKTALLLKSMAETLTDTDADLELSNAYKHFGKELFAKLYPEYFPEQSPVIKDSSFLFSPQTISPNVIIPYTVDYLKPQDPDQRAPKGTGSNNWAVSGSKTKSGHPILCNDPHLKITFPSIWFQIQIKTPEYNAYGVSLPGAPGIVIGFNEYVAWGVTNVGHDVRDWYAIQWKDETKQEYLLDGSYKKTVHFVDTIYVRNGPPVIDTLIFTHWGPIAHSQNGIDLANKWMAHQATSEHITLFKLCKAKNYRDYTEAIKHFSCPAQNVVFAAKDGDIALWAQGKFPLRAPQQGRFVQDGSNLLADWQGYIPQEHNPHEYNPIQGFVSSANQHSTFPNYPYYYTGRFEEFRGRYLNKKLSELSNITIEDMMQLQNDNFSQRAQDFSPYMIRFLKRNKLGKEELELLAILESWNFVYDYQTIAPTIFNTWLNSFKNHLYDEMQNFPDTWSGSKPWTYYPAEWQIFDIFKRDTAHFIIDHLDTKSIKEDIGDILSESFKQASTKLMNEHKSIDSIPTLQYSKNTSIHHLAKIEPFSQFGLPVSGDVSALNATRSNGGPSWRMIVELGPKTKAYGVYPGGQSGNPGSYFYDNMVEKWAQGDYNALLFMANLEDAPSKQILIQQKFN